MKKKELMRHLRSKETKYVWLWVDITKDDGTNFLIPKSVAIAKAHCYDKDTEFQADFVDGNLYIG